MKVDIWMPLYVNDYLSDTLHLTAEENGAYILMMLHYWKKGSIGSDVERIAKIGRVATSIAQALLDEFFEQCSDGTWIHHRVDRELKIASENKDKRREKAKKAAKARWNSENDATSNTTSNHQAMLEQCPSPSPSQYYKEPSPKKGSGSYDPSLMILYKKRDEVQQLLKAIEPIDGTRKDVFHFKKDIERLNALIDGHTNGK